MSKPHRTQTAISEDSFIKTMHFGFNYFHEIDFEKKQKRSQTRNRMQTLNSAFEDGHKTIQGILRDNKQKFERIKTEMQSLREIELNDYIRKALKYQQLLNINDNKKKRLPTLNAKVGEVVKKSVVQLVQKNIEYEMTTNRFRLEGWKPQSREGHTTTIYKNMAVIIGGHCSYPYPIAQVYSFETHSWTKQFNINSGRSYHSAILYKNRFVIVFGGMGTYDVSRKCRVCFNTINLVDLQSWNSRILKMHSEETIEGRRSHCATLMGKYMLVFGGMNTKKQYLKDLVYLDLKELRWYHKQYKIEGKELGELIESGLAKHKMVSYFRNTHKTYPLYSSEYIDNEGLYIFGGLFGNGEQNIVLQISFNKYNPVIKRIDYVGIPPSSIDPILEKMNDNNIIIISGEQTERVIKLFKIKQKQFVGVYKYLNHPFFGGLGSTLSKYEDDYYLLFGLGEEGYIGTVNSFKLNERIIQSEVKKKKERHFEEEWRDQVSLVSDSSFN